MRRRGRTHGLRAWQLLLVMSAAVAADEIPAHRDGWNCGALSVRALAEVCGCAPSSYAWRKAAAQTQADALSISDLIDLGAALGLGLEGWSASVEDLVAQGTPAIVHFREKHFCTFLDGVGGLVRWLDGGVHIRVTPVESVRRTLFLHGPDDLVLERFSTNVPSLRIAASRSHGQAQGVGQTVALEATFQARRPAVLSGEVRIRTNHPHTPDVAIPAQIRVRSRVSVRPAQVFFGTVERGKVYQQCVVFSSREGAALELSWLRSSLPDVSVAEVRRLNSAAVAVDARLTSDAAVGTWLDGTITVQTNMPGKEKIEVPTYAYVTR